MDDPECIDRTPDDRPSPPQPGDRTFVAGKRTRPAHPQLPGCDLPRETRDYLAFLGGSGGSRGFSRCATSAVQPVWWVAPSPSPVSPSKYSEKVGWSDHSGSGLDSMRL